MDTRQRENQWQAYLRHIKFWEGESEWPHFMDEEVRKAFDQRCRTAGLLSQESRRRKPPADEVVQGLPVLIAADIKKRIGKQSAPSYTPLKPALVHKRPAQILPGSVPLP